MRITRTKRFEKDFRTLTPSQKQSFARRLSSFLENPRQPQLNIHSLKGKYSDCYSMNVTGDIRAIFEMMDEKGVRFIAIGSHSKLYS